MQCWLAWHGGSSYAPPEIPRDLEHFDSLRELSDAFWRRAQVGERYYPCVSEQCAEVGGPSGWIFLAEPIEDRDPYPDRTIEFGPRGGLRVTPV